MVLGTNDIDFRSRAHSAEEAEFLAAASRGPADDRHLRRPGEGARGAARRASSPKRNRPIVFLRLRKAARKNGAAGARRRAVRHPRPDQDVRQADSRPRPAARPRRWTVWPTTTLLKLPGAIILVGERLATSPGSALGGKQIGGGDGARLAWIPRRAGERGALEAGALPGLLPGGRPLADASAREQTAAAWNVADLPSTPGRDTAGILAAARSGELGALLIGGVELADLPDPDAALAAIEAAPVRRQPRVAGERGHRPRRRGVPGRAGRREGRLIRQLGGPDSAVRTFAVRPTRFPICGCWTTSPTRSASTSTCRPRWPPVKRWPASGCGAAQRPSAPQRRRGRDRCARQGPGGARRLADAARFGAAAGR